MSDDTPRRGRGRPRIDPAVKAARATAGSVARTARHRAGTVRRTLYVTESEAEVLDRLVQEHGSPSAAVEAAVANLTKT